MEPRFDIAAAWEELDELDADINRRVMASRENPNVQFVSCRVPMRQAWSLG